jgi:hypothetical protein
MTQWAGLVAVKGEKRNSYRALLRKAERDHLKADSHIPSVPLPCRSAKGVDCVFPI